MRRLSLLLSLFLAAPALAQTPPLPGTEIAAGAWQGGGFGAGGRVERCAVALEAPNGLSLILSMSADGSARLGVATPVGALVPGERLETVLRVDGAVVTQGPAEAVDAHVFALPLGESAWVALRRGNELRVEIPGDFAVFPLAGSARAMREVEACAGGGTLPAWDDARLAALFERAGIAVDRLADPERPSGDRPFDATWMVDGSLFGGIESAPRRPGESPERFLDSYLERLAQRCAGGFAAERGARRGSGPVTLQPVVTRCGDAAAVLIVLGSSDRYDVFFHEAAQRDAESLYRVTDRLAAALENTVRG